MKKWTVGKRIILGFGLVIILTAAMAATSLIELQKIRGFSESITDDALPGVSIAGPIVANAGEMQTTLLQHLVSKSASERKAYETTIDQLSEQNGKHLADYERTVSRPEDRAAYDALKEVRAKYLKVRNSFLELSNAGRTDEALAFFKNTLHPAFVSYKKACDGLFDVNRKFGESTSAAIQQTIKTANLLGLILSLAAVGLGITFAIAITRSVTSVLRSMANSLDAAATQVAAASGEVSSASQTLAEGSSEQAASLEETGASLEEISSMTKRNAENAQQANQLARQARSAADAGAVDIQAMNLAMNEIQASSGDIGKIIKTIDEIAFQTNILALNAAVEAARAGEAGMGFAVVADEVRNLAQRSAQAAKETATKIEAAISKTEQGVHLSAKVTAGLQAIVTNVRKADELVAEVASASKEQSQGIEQLNTAVSQMDKVVQSNAASAEETASAAEELKGQAAAMKQSVTELLSLVGGAQAEKTTATQVGRLASGSSRTIGESHQGNSNGNGHSRPHTVAASTYPAQATAEQPETLTVAGDLKNF